MSFMQTSASICGDNSACNQENLTISQCGDILFVAYGPAMYGCEEDVVLKTLAEDGGPEIGTPVLFDMRNVDFKRVDTPVIKRMVRALSNHPNRRSARTVRLVSGDAGFGMMRMYQSLCDVGNIAPETNMLITKSYCDAISWLQGKKPEIHS